MKKLKLVAVDYSSRDVMHQGIQEFPEVPKKVAVLKVPELDPRHMKSLKEALGPDYILVALEPGMDLEIYELEEGDDPHV